MVVMSHVATPSAICAQNPNELPQDLDKFCEEWMDAANVPTGRQRLFHLAGRNAAGCPVAVCQGRGTQGRTKAVDA